MVTAVRKATPRNACKASTTARIAGAAVGDGFGQVLLQALDPFGGMFYFVHVVAQRGFQRGLVEVHLAFHPLHVLLRPGLRVDLRALPVPQQELAQPVPGSGLILLGIFAGADQVAQSFVRRVGNPHRRQVAGAIGAGQFLGVAFIRLHAIARFGGNQRGRDHFAGDTQRRQLPEQNVAGRTGLVTGMQLIAGAQFLHQLPNRFQLIRNHTVPADLAVRYRQRRQQWCPRGHPDQESVF